MTATSRTIAISYDLHPPSGSESNMPGLTPSRSIQVPVKADDDRDIKSYYTTLHHAVEEARNQIGIDLTKWRDAVGKDEALKEPKKNVNEGDDEDEAEEEP
ncbi:hypothetical protein E1B28_009153 [Marasmius oreades]|uniref:Uncharacterized protein n=1 Tax=Marasmius oreades TaxID=181124 RepID=A0A9P7UV09_9AGAR|nr:uncharacterized protein E1B28_009153 [Marasmius oreades]KAG7092839.1 hypothetical protein E1B28_009153 [Marasmius oreades]